MLFSKIVVLQCDLGHRSCEHASLHSFCQLLGMSKGQPQHGDRKLRCRTQSEIEQTWYAFEMFPIVIPTGDAQEDEVRMNALTSMGRHDLGETLSVLCKLDTLSQFPLGCTHSFF